jgi:hypothetical protein
MTLSYHALILTVWEQPSRSHLNNNQAIWSFDGPGSVILGPHPHASVLFQSVDPNNYLSATTRPQVLTKQHPIVRAQLPVPQGFWRHL